MRFLRPLGWTPAPSYVRTVGGRMADGFVERPRSAPVVIERGDSRLERALDQGPAGRPDPGPLGGADPVRPRVRFE
jgi:hypothetical protein